MEKEINNDTKIELNNESDRFKHNKEIIEKYGNLQLEMLHEMQDKLSIQDMIVLYHHCTYNMDFAYKTYRQAVSNLRKLIRNTLKTSDSLWTIIDKNTHHPILTDSNSVLVFTWDCY